MCAPRIALLALLLSPLAATAQSSRRLMTPADLFRVERVGQVAWSATGHRATVEIRRPGRWLDNSIPTFALHLLDVRTGAFATLRAPGGAYVGWFGATWSPDGRRLAFLSLDTNGVIRPWIWEAASGRARPIPGVEMRHATGDPAVILWSDAEHALLFAVDSGVAGSGSLRFRIDRGRNMADEWKRAREGRVTATVMESGGPDTTAPALMSRIVRVNVRTGARRTIARAPLHLPRLSPDGRTLAFLEERPGVPGARAAQYFATRGAGDDAYDRLVWGATLNVLDVATGEARAPAVDLRDPEYASFRWLADGTPAIRDRDSSGTDRWLGVREGRFAPIALAPADTTRAGAPAPPPLDAPRPGARAISRSPAGTGALFVADDRADGTRLWLARPQAAPRELWHGNAWLRDVRLGRTEAIAYTATDGRALTGWLLYPPGYVAGARIPIVTFVYPGTLLRPRTEYWAFDPLAEHFEHPQLFAALGYGVVVPSMPQAAQPLQSDAIGALPVGVLPLLDTLVARGVADSTRLAVIGQSAGGFAVLGLVTRTDRFRTAIASGSFSNLLSRYGTFYGANRYGDGGHPQAAQLARMLQFERGYYGAGAPPWEQPARYLDNSPILRAGRVRTPVMLVHGDLDFVPAQQAEEFFTALYRQDKRARFVRYHGEWHTIAARANVLDLWERMDAWLRETMGP